MQHQFPVEQVLLGVELPEIEAIWRVRAGDAEQVVDATRVRKVVAARPPALGVDQEFRPAHELVEVEIEGDQRRVGGRPGSSLAACRVAEQSRRAEPAYGDPSALQ